MKLIKSMFVAILGIFFKILFFFIGEPKISSNLKRTNELYGKGGFVSLFAKIRSWDAPYDLVEKIVPKSGKILDLGSGDGLMANYLALSSKNREVFGIELNRDRVKDSFKGLKNTHFIYGDIVKHRFPPAETVLLIHVLHHLPSLESQEILLERISKYLKKGQKLIILEIDYKPMVKYVISFLTDAIIVPILFEKRLISFDFHYRRKRDWTTLIKAKGFDIKAVKSVHRGMPFSHVLIFATKK